MKDKDSSPKRRRKSTATGTVELTTLEKGSVHVEKAGTINLGDYNSYKLSVSTTLPINYTEEDIRKAREAIQKANDLVQEEIEKIMEKDDIEFE